LNLTGRLSALRLAGFRVTLVSSAGERLDEIAAREGAHSIAVPIEREIALFSDLVSLFRLWRMLGELKPDLTEFSSPKAGLLGNVAAWLRGVPVRVYMLRGLKLERSGKLMRVILLASERIASACAHVVLCNSPSLLAKARALRVAPAHKLALLGSGSSNGVDVDKFCPGPSEVRKGLGLAADVPVLGFVGRLTRDKGIPELVEAFEGILKAFPDAHLLLVGWFDAADDALGDETRARIQGNRHIHCTGFVADTAPYYRAMDVLVLPTWREGFPNVVLEAAASGIPAVTTLSTGSRDAVVPEVTGLLIPPGYPEAISESVIALLRDPIRRRRMGRAAREWVMEHFENERVLGLTVEFYRNLIGEKSG
jgi:glycosyltransferase involved in cell wall biosynthesis